ncbi:MAG: hypothetical protein WDN04_21965 [Rhodospirillales bacterium]
MNPASETIILYTVGAAAVAVSLPKVITRLELSRAKHPSISGHSRWARRLAAWVPGYGYDEAQFFGTDGAPAEIAERRRAGFMRLSDLYRERFAQTVALTAGVEDGISDLQFTSAYRVPFQFSKLVRTHLKAGAFVASSAGVTITDLDGNRFYDLTGSLRRQRVRLRLLQGVHCQGQHAGRRSRPGAGFLPPGGRV